MPLAFKSDQGYYVTPFGRILENRAIEVTISDELYAFIDNQSEEPVTFETINKHYKPTIPSIPMVDNLRVPPKARNGYNQNIMRLNKQRPKPEPRKLLSAGDEL